VAEYDFADRLLHRAALQFAPAAETWFDIDQRFVTLDPAETAAGRHIFISSLARSGTTILMRRLHASDAFRSLTYNDMPFVMAPILWSRLAGRSKRNIVAQERAHGDGIIVDENSPVALEGAFWRILDGRSYIANTHLSPHQPDPDILRNYVGYVSAVLQSDPSGRRRYLAKNNNNTLRLPAIRSAFPNAVILIPLREPVSQAASLLRQHRNFVAQHKQDPFSRDYMGWLAHHEFGLDHRPFRFDSSKAVAAVTGETDTLAYWIARWVDAYLWLERTAPEGSVFICYEDLCSDAATWHHIAQICEISGEAGGEREFALPEMASDPGDPGGMQDEAMELYRRLRERARICLS